MHVAVEATRLLSELRGIGRYVRALLPRMAAARTDLRYTLFVKHEGDGVPLLASLAQDGLPAARCTCVPVSQMRYTSADVFWFPWNVIRPEPPRGPVVVTIHDIVPLVIPSPQWNVWRKWRRLRRWRRLYAKTTRRATLVVADSAFTAAELQRVLGIGNDRIRVALLGADHFEPCAAPDASVLARLGVREPFFLAVGADEPRKNLAVAYRAMARLATQEQPATLVLAGPPHQGWKSGRPDAAWLHDVGFISDTDLAVLYRHAAALLFPSRYEGFGLPALEAMRSGTPVVCARATSLPEVGGNAVAYFEPDDDATLAVTLARMLDDDTFGASLRRVGLERADTFRWDDTACTTLRALEEARLVS